MHSDITAPQLIKHLKDQIAEHQRMIREAENQLQAIESAQASFMLKQDISRAYSSIGEARDIIDAGALKDLEVNLQGAQNMKERIIRIAEAVPNGVVNATEVTKYLINSGIHQAQVKDMRPNVFRVFDDNPEVFEKVSPGNWRLIAKLQPIQEHFLDS